MTEMVATTASVAAPPASRTAPPVSSAKGQRRPIGRLLLGAEPFRVKVSGSTVNGQGPIGSRTGVHRVGRRGWVFGGGRADLTGNQRRLNPMGRAKRMRQDIAEAGCGVLGLFCRHDGAVALVDAGCAGLVDRRGVRAGIGSRLLAVGALAGALASFITDWWEYQFVAASVGSVMSFSSSGRSPCASGSAETPWPPEWMPFRDAPFGSPKPSTPNPVAAGAGSMATIGSSNSQREVGRRGEGEAGLNDPANVSVGDHLEVVRAESNVLIVIPHIKS